MIDRTCKAATAIAVMALAVFGCASTAPAPAPTPSVVTPPVELALPLVGDAHAVDAFGYPTAYVDRVKLQAMLRERRFVELTAALEAAQAEFERDWHHEYWAHDTVDAFPADPAFEPLFAAWVAATPTSFAPWAARGAWWSDCAVAARGTRLARDTSADQFARTDALNANAVVDLAHALTLQPRAVSASRRLVVVGRYSSGAVDVDRVARQGLRLCPNCLHIRAAVIAGLVPRWGGSHEEMAAFATQSLAGTTNPRLRVLAGYIEHDRAQDAADPVEKLRLLDAAIAHGEASDFFRARAAVRKIRDREGALADLRKVVQLRPAVGSNHAALAVGLVEHGDWREAEAEMRLALALDGPDVARSALPAFRFAIRSNVRQPTASLELLDLALAFEDDPRLLADVQRRRTGRTSLVAAVDEPAAWATAVPPPAELVTLLTSDDSALRNAAWCRLLEAGLRRHDDSLAMLRCEVARVETAVSRDGAALVGVVPVVDGGGPLVVVQPDGALTVLGRGIALGDRHSDVVVVARRGQGERKAMVTFTAVATGPGTVNAVLTAQVVDTVPLPALRVALGGPVQRMNVDDRGAAAPLTWRMQKQARALELVTRDTRPKVVARYTWNDAKGTWQGPAGSPREGFKRIDGGSPGDVQRDVQAWNAALAGR